MIRELSDGYGRLPESRSDGITCQHARHPVMNEMALAPRTQDRLDGPNFPAVLVRANTAACFAADEFFRARLSNPHTRRAYARHVSRFLTWCEDPALELHQVSPGLVDLRTGLAEIRLDLYCVLWLLGGSIVPIVAGLLAIVQVISGR